MVRSGWWNCSPASRTTADLPIALSYAYGKWATDNRKRAEMGKGQPPSIPTLTVIGIDPGETTGWAKISIPRDSIFGDEPGRIVDFQHGEWTGPETAHALAFCRVAKRYIWPAVVVEDFTLRTSVTSREVLAPVRVGAMIRFCVQTSMAGSVVGFEWQLPSLAFETMPDNRLEKAGLWVEGSAHIRDAARHAMTLIRRAKRDPKLAARIFHWPGDGDPHGAEALIGAEG